MQLDLPVEGRRQSANHKCNAHKLAPTNQRAFSATDQSQPTKFYYQFVYGRHSTSESA